MKIRMGHVVLVLVIMLALNSCNQAPANNSKHTDAPSSVSDSSLARAEFFNARPLGSSPDSPMEVGNGDALILNKETVYHMVISDDMIIYRPKEGDSTGIQWSIISDDMVLFKPDTSGLEFRIKDMDADTARLEVSSTTLNPSTADPRPDHVFCLEECFVSADRHSIKVIGVQYEASSNQSNPPVRGAWEFGLEEIRSIVLPEVSYVSGKTELWVFIND